MASSTSSPSFIPCALRNLMPFSGAGLCEAEMTTPASAPSLRVRNPMPGVGRMPKSITSAPLASKPSVRAACKTGPDARVSLPTTKTGAERLFPPKTRAAAAPSERTKASVIGSLPANPRMPSVPKYLGLAIGSIPIENDLRECQIRDDR